MVCENQRMSFIMGALLEAQREQAAFERLLSEGPKLGLPRADRAHVGRLLSPVDDSDLERSLHQAREPVRTLLTVSPFEVAVSELQSSRALEALSEYPLDSPKLLGAAQVHGIDERILTEVAEALQRKRRGRG
ncbi:hypothetical protein [Nocardioides flavescens]|uniref:Uncharacterized protein n=1 Tax=Nocardioides flavescens TaxID=2691959 RepID=A0A6L7EM84_9ACTN|nr:hypothetical protein [Nocardioides flavescens]MXG88433.1 hypothetical protein [Nocardioides flavescens]